MRLLRAYRCHVMAVAAGAFVVWSSQFLTVAAPWWWPLVAFVVLVGAGTAALLEGFDLWDARHEYR